MSLRAESEAARVNLEQGFLETENKLKEENQTLLGLLQSAEETTEELNNQIQHLNNTTNSTAAQVTELEQMLQATREDSKVQIDTLRQELKKEHVDMLKTREMEVRSECRRQVALITPSSYYIITQITNILIYNIYMSKEV